MDNLIELYEFLDGCDAESLQLKITEMIRTLNDKYGTNSGFILINHLNNAKTLMKMTKYQFEKGHTVAIEQSINFGKSYLTMGTKFTDSSSDYTPCVEKQDAPAIEKYRSMDSGDINFLRSILPYDKNYIRYLCRNGTLPYEKPKGKYIFNRSQVEEWKKQHGSEHKKELLSIGKRIKADEAKKKLIKTL